MGWGIHVKKKENRKKKLQKGRHVCVAFHLSGFCQAEKFRKGLKIQAEGAEWTKEQKQMQADLGDIASSVPDHCNEASHMNVLDSQHI